MPSLTRGKESSVHLLGHEEFHKFLSTWTFSISEPNAVPLPSPLGNLSLYIVFGMFTWNHDLQEWVTLSERFSNPNNPTSQPNAWVPEANI